MNSINKLILFSLFLICSWQFTNAQNDDAGWRVGGGVGFMSYYGDLSPDWIQATKDHYKFWDIQPEAAYMLSVERRLNSSFSFMLSASQGYVSASDRDYEDNDFFARSLNFRSRIRSANASFVLRADNDRFLGYRSFFAPYIFAGAGITDFKTSADLLDADGNFYNYLVDNVERDFDYETELAGLGADSETNYNTYAINLNAGVGIRFRITSFVSLHLQSELRYLLSDYLDDVASEDFRDNYDSDLQAFAGRPNPTYSGPRNNNNGLNDMFAFTSASLRISFGRKKEGFNAPTFYAGNTPYQAMEKIELLEKIIPITNDSIILYDSIKVVQEVYQINTDTSGIGQTQVLLDSLQTVQMNQEELRNKLDKVQEQYTVLNNSLNTNTAASETEQRIKDLQQEITNLSIVSSEVLKTSEEADSTQQQKLTDISEELKQLRTDITNLNEAQQKQKQQNIESEAAKDVPNNTVPSATNTNVPANNNTEAAVNTEYQNLRTDLNALSVQIAELTGTLQAQQANTNKPMVVEQPTPINTATVAPNTNTQQADNMQLQNSLQDINNQLSGLNARISNIEGRVNSMPATAQPATNTIIQPIPAAPNNQAEIQRLQDENDVLRKQLNQMQQQMNTLQQQIKGLNKEAAKTDTGAKMSQAANTVATTDTTSGNTLVEDKLKQEQTATATNATTKQAVSSTKEPATTNSQASRSVSTAYLTEVDRVGTVSIFFDTNATLVKNSEMAKLQQVANIIRQYPEAIITINGYADGSGSAEYNKKLSESRARSVYNRLLNDLKVNPKQVAINAYGESNSAANNSATDRRVDLKWVK